jgi:hypothetical protein
VVLRWSGVQPACGTLRACAEALGCVDGDLLFVPLEDGREAFTIRRTERDAARGLQRLALELGLAEDASLAAIAGAVGLAPTADVADLRARLRARQQDELQGLLSR